MNENKKDHRMEDILLYEQNLLEPDERRELEEHMPGCAECQATLAKVKHYLPVLKRALQPNELPAEELLRRAKAQLEANKERPLAKVLPFRRVRVVATGLALAGAAAAAIAVQSLLPSLEVAKGEHDAGAEPRILAAPRRPETPDAGPDDSDAGPDGETRENEGDGK